MTGAAPGRSICSICALCRCRSTTRNNDVTVVVFILCAKDGELSFAWDSRLFLGARNRAYEAGSHTRYPTTACVSDTAASTADPPVSLKAVSKAKVGTTTVRP